MAALQDELAETRRKMAEMRDENDKLKREFGLQSDILASRTGELLLSKALSDAENLRNGENSLKNHGGGYREFLENSPQLRVLQTRLAALDTENTQLRNDLLDSEHRYEFATTARELLKQEVRELENRLGVVMANGPGHVAEFEFIQAQLTKQRDENRQISAESAQKIRNLSAEIAVLKAENEKLRGSDLVNSAVFEAQDAKFGLELLREKADQLASQLAIAHEDRAALREDLAHARSALVSAKDEFGKRETKWREERDEHVAELEKVSADLAELEHFRRSYASMQSALASERETLRNEVTELNSLLGSHLAGRDTESLATQRLIAEVARHKETLATAQGDLEQARAENNRLRVEMLEVREGMAAKIRESEGEKERVMRRTVEIATAADAAASAHSATRAELAQATATLATATAELDEVRRELAVAVAQQRQWQTAAEQLKQERRRDHAEFAGFGDRMREVRDALSRAKAHNGELVEQVLTLRTKVDELSSALETAEATHAEELAGAVGRLRDELQHEAASRQRETAVLSARLARADEDRRRGEERAAGEARRVQGLLDRAREEAVLAGSKLPGLVQERAQLARELERVGGLVPQLEERVRSLAIELEQSRSERTRSVSTLTSRISSLESATASATATATRNDHLARELERLRADNTRLVAEIRRWRDKRISQVVQTPWGDDPGLPRTREEDGWAGRDALAAQRALGGSGR